MGGSADRAYLAIACQEGFLTSEEAASLEQGARDRGVPVAGYAVDSGALAPEQVGQVMTLRFQLRRLCRACDQVTFVLPGQPASEVPCEGCGGPLTPARASQRRERPASGRHERASGRHERPERPERASGRHERPERASGRHERPERASGRHERPERASGRHEGPERASGRHERPERASGRHEGAERASGRHEQAERGSGRHERPERASGRQERSASGLQEARDPTQEEAPPPALHIQGVGASSGSAVQSPGGAPKGGLPPAIQEALAQLKKTLLADTYEAAQLRSTLLKGGAAFLVVLALIWVGGALFGGSIPWKIRYLTAEHQAKEAKVPLVVYVTNPTDKNCQKFYNEVLEDSDVTQHIDDCMWLSENVARGEDWFKNRSNDFRALPEGKATDASLPHLLVYGRDGKIVGGALAAHKNMTAEDLDALLRKALGEED
jgi:hypothetical protein